MPANKKIDDARFATMWFEGLPATLIAEAFGVTEVTVSHTWRRLRLPARRPGGELYELGAAALSKSIRAIAALGIDSAIVAAAFGVREELVSDLYADLEAERRRAVPAGASPPVPIVPGRALWTPDRDARILGLSRPPRYRDLARLAEEWGLRMRDVEARFHRLRAGA